MLRLILMTGLCVGLESPADTLNFPNQVHARLVTSTLRNQGHRGPVLSRFSQLGCGHRGHESQSWESVEEGSCGGQEWVFPCPAQGTMLQA